MQMLQLGVSDQLIRQLDVMIENIDIEIYTYSEIKKHLYDQNKNDNDLDDEGLII